MPNPAEIVLPDGTKVASRANCPARFSLYWLFSKFDENAGMMLFANEAIPILHQTARGDEQRSTYTTATSARALIERWIESRKLRVYDRRSDELLKPLTGTASSNDFPGYLSLTDSIDDEMDIDRDELVCLIQNQEEKMTVPLFLQKAQDASEPQTAPVSGPVKGDSVPDQSSSPEYIAGWLDESMHALSWWGYESITPIYAALILAGHNPNKGTDAKTIEAAETTTSGGIGPDEFRALKNNFEGASKDKPRTLKDWMEYARHHGQKIHSWLGEWIEASGVMLAVPLAAPAIELVTHDTAQPIKALKGVEMYASLHQLVHPYIDTLYDNLPAEVQDHVTKEFSPRAWNTSSPMGRAGWAQYHDDQREIERAELAQAMLIHGYWIKLQEQIIEIEHKINELGSAQNKNSERDFNFQNQDLSKLMGELASLKGKWHKPEFAIGSPQQMELDRNRGDANLATIEMPEAVQFLTQNTGALWTEEQLLSFISKFQINLYAYVPPWTPINIIRHNADGFFSRPYIEPGRNLMAILDPMLVKSLWTTNSADATTACYAIPSKNSDIICFAEPVQVDRCDIRLTTEILLQILKEWESIRRIGAPILQTSQTPVEAQAAPAGDMVKLAPESVAKGVTKAQILTAFGAILIKGKKQETVLNAMENGYVWAVRTRLAQGTRGRGGHESQWCPVLMAIELHERKFATKAALSHAFFAHQFLAKWREQWREHSEAI